MPRNRQPAKPTAASCECGANPSTLAALNSHRKGAAHRAAMAGRVGGSDSVEAERLRAEAAEQLEPLEEGDVIDDRPVKRADAAQPKRNRGRADAIRQGKPPEPDVSDEIQREIAAGRGEYAGLGEDDYEKAARLDRERLANDDLDAVDVTGHAAGAKRDRGRGRGEPARGRDVEDREIDRSGETPPEDRVREAPGPFADRDDYGRESLRRGVISGEGEAEPDDDRRAGGAYVAPDERRRERTEADPEEMRDEYDVAVGDAAKKVDAFFEWCLDIRGHRHTFSRFYYRKNLVLDFYDNAREAVKREVADKSRAIARHNAGAKRADRIGYVALVVGTPLRYEDLAAAERGEVVPRLADHLPKGEVIGTGRTVDMSAPAQKVSEVGEAVAP